ncbi:MAG: hypothetical protein ACI810_003005 [Gammaproteobacteria bacterium]|jgi:hypothetical protein
MANENVINQSLELIASLSLGSSKASQLSEQLANIDHWESFVAQLEINGLAPIFNQQLRAHDELSELVPKTVSLQVKALVVRHQRATDVRSKAITEILPEFAKHNIEVIALKGLALAYCVYPEPRLRPMRDIDLLVPKHQALTAQQALRDIGYQAEDHNVGAMYDHHHLPIASKIIDDMTMSIEVHHNALSGDVASSMSYADLTQPPIHFEIEGHSIGRFGHIDTLRHLCHHAFEPAKRIKLGALLDILTYAETFHEEIDWTDLRTNHPFVINALRCLHFVIPLPKQLCTQLIASSELAPTQLGQGYLPLSHLAAQKRGLTKTLQTMFTAPQWWAHIFYSVAPEKSLFWVNTWRHPLQVLQWLTRRYWALMRGRSSD